MSEQVNVTTEQAREAIAAKDALIELYEDPRFKLVFTEGYFGMEAKRLPLALVDDEMQDEIEQRILAEKIKSIGHLHVYLNTVVALGRNMEAGLEAHERELTREALVTGHDEVTGEPVYGEGE